MAETSLHPTLYTIITITKDNADGLRKTCDSVTSQTYQDFEWIIIDGGADHETESLVKPLKVQWHRGSDDGIYDAMNKGLDLAKGQYVLFLNAGDRLAAPDTLMTLSKVLKKRERPPSLIYGDALEETASGPHLKPARPHTQIAWGLFTHHQAMLYNREAIGDLRFPPGYTIAADYAFTAIFLLVNPRALYVKKPICIFERGGISQHNIARGRMEQFSIRNELNIVSPGQNAWIVIVQFFASSLKRYMPWLYWALRK